MIDIICPLHPKLNKNMRHCEWHTPNIHYCKRRPLIFQQFILVYCILLDVFLRILSFSVNITHKNIRTVISELQQDRSEASAYPSVCVYCI